MIRKQTPRDSLRRLEFSLDSTLRQDYNNCAQVNSAKSVMEGQCGMKGETERYDALKLENQVCFPLYACTKELVRQYGPYLKELNLTYTQYIVMMVLWERERVSSRQLAECLHLDYGTLTPVLKRLDQAGYLIRERAEEDERLLTLTLTRKGRDLKEQAARIPPAIGACMGLTPEEFGMLYTLTYKALKHMEERRQEDEANECV